MIISQSTAELPILESGSNQQTATLSLYEHNKLSLARALSVYKTLASNSFAGGLYYSSMDSAEKAEDHLLQLENYEKPTVILVARNKLIAIMIDLALIYALTYMDAVR